MKWRMGVDTRAAGAAWRGGGGGEGSEVGVRRGPRERMASRSVISGAVSGFIFETYACHPVSSIYLKRMTALLYRPFKPISVRRRVDIPTHIAERMQSGPSGPPPAGPSGTLPPTKPSGPPSGRAKGRPTRGPPQQKQPTEEGAFAKLAEQKEERQREINRRETSVERKELRNSSRINVVLMLLLVVVFGEVALWPITYGDISANPHQNTAENVIIDRNDPENPKAWSTGDVELMESKIWDGKGQFSGSF